MYFLPLLFLRKEGIPKRMAYFNENNKIVNYEKI